MKKKQSKKQHYSVENKEYWKDRFLQLENSSHEKGVSYIQMLDEQYVRASSELDKEIRSWYQRVAKNNNISMDDAKKLLSKGELKEFKWSVEDYIKYGEENAIDPKYMIQLENASARFHINRLEALKLNTQQTIEKLYGNQLDQIDTLMRDVYSDSMYHAAYELQKGFGVGWNFAQINDDKLEKIMSKPWGVTERNFSEDIWKNKQKLINELHNELTQMCVLGRTPDEAIKNISKKLNTSYGRAKTLVMTESAYFTSMADYDTFKRMGVEEYEILATLDSHTSSICQSMDGEHFPLNQFEVGVTAHPFHPNCRTVEIPYFDDEFTLDEERIARDTDDGTLYYIPGNITYPEWKTAFVDGDDRSAYQVYFKNGIKHFQRPKVETLKTLDELSDIWWDSLSEDQQSAFRAYTSGYAMDINQYHRGLYDFYEEDVKMFNEMTIDLDNAINQFELNQNITVYRSVTPSAFTSFGISEEQFIEEYYTSIENAANLQKKMGKVIEDKAYMSTATNLDEVFRLNDSSGIGAVYEIEVPKGSKGAYLGKHSSIEDQTEFLLGRNTKLKIESVEPYDYKWIDDYGEERITSTFKIKATVVTNAEDFTNVVMDDMIDARKIKLDISSFPGAFTKKSELKNTEKMIEYINNLDHADQRVLKLYNSMGEMENIEKNGISFKITHGKNHQLSYSYSIYDGSIVDVKLNIPKLQGEDLTGQISTTLHEEMHYIDFMNRDSILKNGKYFSMQQEKLVDIVINSDAMIGDDARALFKQFKEERSDVLSAIADKYNPRNQELNELWMNRKISWKEYNKEFNKMKKLRDIERDYAVRNLLGGGVPELEDIYDALSGGVARDYDLVIYGHGQKYYRDIDSRVHEIIANYGSLSVLRPDLIEILRKDHPELVEELDKTIDRLLLKVGG